jgi:hypothetical protein
MLVKILDADPDFVEALKNQTRQNTGSKAYAKAAFEYQLMRVKIADLERQIEDLDRRHDVALAVIENARSAAALLLDRTAQGLLDV